VKRGSRIERGGRGGRKKGRKEERKSVSSRRVEKSFSSFRNRTNLKTHPEFPLLNPSKLKVLLLLKDRALVVGEVSKDEPAKTAKRNGEWEDEKKTQSDRASRT